MGSMHSSKFSTEQFGVEVLKKAGSCMKAGQRSTKPERSYTEWLSESYSKVYYCVEAVYHKAYLILPAFWLHKLAIASYKLF